MTETGPFRCKGKKKKTGLFKVSWGKQGWRDNCRGAGAPPPLPCQPLHTHHRQLCCSPPPPSPFSLLVQLCLYPPHNFLSSSLSFSPSFASHLFIFPSIPTFFVSSPPFRTAYVFVYIFSLTDCTTATLFTQGFVWNEEHSEQYA